MLSFVQKNCNYDAEPRARLEMKLNFIRRYPNFFTSQPIGCELRRLKTKKQEALRNLTSVVFFFLIKFNVWTVRSLGVRSSVTEERP